MTTILRAFKLKLTKTKLNNYVSNKQQDLFQYDKRGC